MTMTNKEQELLDAWVKAGRPRTIDCDGNARLIAGLYLDWAGGDRARAIRRLEIHASGQYVDCPPFRGCNEAAQALKDCG